MIVGERTKIVKSSEGLQKNITAELIIDFFNKCVSKAKLNYDQKKNKDSKISKTRTSGSVFFIY